MPFLIYLNHLERRGTGEAELSEISNLQWVTSVTSALPSNTLSYSHVYSLKRI